MGELGVGESWKEECKDRMSWAKLIAPRKGTATKAEVARAQRKEKEGLGGVGGNGGAGSNGGVRNVSKGSNVNGTAGVRMCKGGGGSNGGSSKGCKGSNVKVLAVVELTAVTKRTRMKASEREELLLECGGCGRRFRREQDINRHTCATTRRRAGAGRGVDDALFI